ncbi:hypothetical protein LCGC14_2757380, partial [marine sediment metagenome]
LPSYISTGPVNPDDFKEVNEIVAVEPLIDSK